ncbi:MAG: PEP-CTERM sorting domain-containing protein [Planctomycetota bacterium]
MFRNEPCPFRCHVREPTTLLLLGFGAVMVRRKR